jgi:hypothetical protein
MAATIVDTATATPRFRSRDQNPFSSSCSDSAGLTSRPPTVLWLPSTGPVSRRALHCRLRPVGQLLPYQGTFAPAEVARPGELSFEA